MRWVALTAAMFALLLVSFDQGWKRGWDAHVEAEMQEASRAYQLAPDTLKAEAVLGRMDSLLVLAGYDPVDTVGLANGERAIAWKITGRPSTLLEIK